GSLAITLRGGPDRLPPGLPRPAGLRRAQDRERGRRRGRDRADAHQLRARGRHPRPARGRSRLTPGPLGPSGRAMGDEFCSLSESSGQMAIRDVRERTAMTQQANAEIRTVNVPGATLYVEVRGSGRSSSASPAARPTPARTATWPHSWPTGTTVGSYDQRGSRSARGRSRGHSGLAAREERAAILASGGDEPV